MDERDLIEMMKQMTDEEKRELLRIARGLVDDLKCSGDQSDALLLGHRAPHR